MKNKKVYEQGYRDGYEYGLVEQHAQAKLEPKPVRDRICPLCHGKGYRTIFLFVYVGDCAYCNCTGKIFTPPGWVS